MAELLAARPPPWPLCLSAATGVLTWPKRSWYYQESSVQGYKSIIQKGPTPEEGIPVLRSAIKKAPYAERLFAPLLFQIPNGTINMHKDIPCRVIHVTRTGIVPSQPQECFSTSLLAKHLCLAIPWSCPCAAFPGDAVISDQHQLLLQLICKPLPQHKNMLSYKLVFQQGGFTNSYLIPDNETAQTIGCRKQEAFDWICTTFYTH